MDRMKGFTLLEVLVVIVIISLISMMVVPDFLDWRRNAKLRDATLNLKADLELAKLRAVQENAHVAIVFDRDHYKVFVDNGAGIDGIPDDWARNGTERLLRNRQLPAGVSIDLAKTAFGSVGTKTRFKGKGTTLAGSAVLMNSGGERRDVVVTTVGRIRIEKKKT